MLRPPYLHLHLSWFFLGLHLGWRVANRKSFQYAISRVCVCVCALKPFNCKAAVVISDIA